MGHEDELTIEELQELLNEEHQETQQNVSPSEQEKDEKEDQCRHLPLKIFLKSLMKDTVTGLYRVFPINPLGESLGPELSYFISNPLRKKPRYAD
ncbi:hypothetical protein TNCV_5132581 [Trichonephila clavipes]|nr:hypothetical protein TNCV_5132581 [Trichonephila clavipes]